MTEPKHTVTFHGRSDGKRRPAVIVLDVRLPLDESVPVRQEVYDRCRELADEGLYEFGFHTKPKTTTGADGSDDDTEGA